MSQQNEISTILRLMNNFNKEMKKENERAIKESFKNAGFTEVESFSLLQTIIKYNNGGNK